MLHLKELLGCFQLFLILLIIPVTSNAVVSNDFPEFDLLNGSKNFKNLPNCIILDSRVFEIFILADELFAKAL